MSDCTTSTTLACLVYSWTRFSWILRQVQFDTVNNFNGIYAEEGTKQGPVTRSDVDEHGVFCVDCQKNHNHDDLVPCETEEDDPFTLNGNEEREEALTNEH